VLSLTLFSAAEVFAIFAVEHAQKTSATLAHAIASTALAELIHVPRAALVLAARNDRARLCRSSRVVWPIISSRSGGYANRANSRWIQARYLLPKSIASGERCECVTDNRSPSSETRLTPGYLHNRRMPSHGMH
jgi:hypothetical protein